MTLDFSDDWMIWDNKEPVDLTTTDSEEYPLSDVLFRALTLKEQQASGGAYTASDRKVLVPKSLLSDYDATLKPKDVITRADGSAWTILEVGLNTFETWWSATVRNLAIAFDLRDLLTVKRPTNTKDNALGRVATFANVYANIPCKIQDDTAEDAERFGKAVTLRRYKIWVDRQLTLTAEDQLVDQGGNLYSFVDFRNTDQIGELPMITAERRSKTT